MICISCGRTHRYQSADNGHSMQWLRTDSSTALGICSFCEDAVVAWDQGARDVRTLAQAKATHQQQQDMAGWLVEHAKLPSLPHVLIEIYRELESDIEGIDRIVELLETDTGLTARALQLGNSAYYGSTRQISQVSDAILRIGPFDLWALLLSTEVKSLFCGISPSLIDMNRFWRHSLLTACACRELGEAQGLASADDLFVAGLIHDIGKLLFLQRIPLEYVEVVKSGIAGDGLCEVETDLLGVDHAELGGRLLESWGLPEPLIRLTRFHHQADALPEEEIQLLRQADQLAHVYLDEATDPGFGLPSKALLLPIIERYETLVELVL